jgi:tetratricopeptide (TPR) repeat protein
LGQKYGLPEPISTHGYYYFETLRTHQFKENYISIGISADRLKSVFEEVIDKGIFTHPYVLPHENNKPIYFCRKPKMDLGSYWLLERNIDPDFLDILENQGVDAAIAFYYESKEKDPATLFFSESQMNALGYKHLFAGKIKEAIVLFKLNVTEYPEAFNVYDSLGEGYMENGQYDLAIINYEKSLEINPNNTNAREKLSELAKLKNNTVSKEE